MLGNKEVVILDDSDPWFIVLFYRILHLLQGLVANDNNKDQLPPAADE